MDIFGAKEEQLSRKGVRLFSSKLEIRDGIPCKLYNIDETFDCCQKEHTHDYVQIWYVYKGQFTHFIHNQPYKMVKGNLFLVPPYATHRNEFVPNEKVEIFGCEFRPDFIEAPIPMTDVSTIPKITLAGGDENRVYGLFKEMVEEYREGKPYFESLLKGSVIRLISLMQREYRFAKEQRNSSKSDKYWPCIQNAVQYIHRHYNEEIRLDVLCRHLKISKTSFCSLFKGFTGKTFSDYVTDVRISVSTEFLLKSDLSVTDVCYGVGFNDPTYFAKTFKKYTGVTPSSYKKSANKCGYSSRITRGDESNNRFMVT